MITNKVIVTNDYKFNSLILNFLLLFFFLQKDFTSTKKAQNRLQLTKIKNVYKKHLREKKSLIRLFAFCAFDALCFYAFIGFSAFNAFSACKIFL